MTYRLCVIRPDGTEYEADTDKPIITRADAGMWAGLTLASLSGPTGILISEMGAFADRVTTTPLGEVIAHEASGYSFRVEEN